MIYGFSYSEIANGLFGAMIVMAAFGGMIAKFKGLITFGKPVERRNGCKAVCDDHNELVTQTALSAKGVKDLKERQVTVLDEIRLINGSVDEINKNVHELIGWHKRNGFTK